MPRDGSGNYSLPAGTTATANTTIESSKYNTFTADVASALSASIAADGQKPFSADQPMGGHKLTGLAAGSAAGDSVRYEQAPASIMTTRGDLIRRGASAPERVALGAAGQFLQSDGTDAAWSNFALPNSISPTALGTDQNDYAPTSLSTASVIRQDLSAAVNITGLTGGASGRVMVIRNINATYNITLKDASVSSTAANRFAFGRDVVLQPKQDIVLLYDATASRWTALALPDLAPTLTSGFVATVVDDGTKSTGTYTPTPVGGNYRKCVNGGAFTLAAPSATGDFTMVIQLTNNGSAGAITLSGFTKTTGDSFTTTNANVFLLYIAKVNGSVHLNVVAMQ